MSISEQNFNSRENSQVDGQIEAIGVVIAGRL